MRTILATVAVMAGILAQAWGQSSAVRYDNATKAVTAPIPFRVGQSAVDPTAPGNGSLWYDTANNTLEARINGATVSLGAASTITGADTQVTFFDGANNPAGDAGLTYNKTTDTMSVGDLAIADGSFTLGGFTLTNPGAGGTIVTTGTLASGALTLSGIFPDDVRQTFKPGATVAGMNVGSFGGNPSTPTNGDIWYDSMANTLDARIGGVNVSLGNAILGADNTWTGVNTFSNGLNGNIGTTPGTGAFTTLSATGRATATTFGHPSYLTSSLYFLSANDVRFTLSGADVFYTQSNRFGILTDIASITMGSTLDVQLHRDAANTLAQRNGTAAQTLRVYNTYATAGVDHEYGSFGFSANTLSISARHGGTGIFRPISLTASAIDFWTHANTYGSTAMRWQINTSGHFVAGTANTYDIGSTTAAPKNVFADGYISVKEMASPGVAGADRARIYAKDNGSGKTQLMVIFPSGAEIQLAIEP